MIFYKKKSWSKKTIQKISKIFIKNTKIQSDKDFGFFAFLKTLFISLGFLIFALYVSFLFFLPCFVKEDFIEDFINEQVSKNSSFKVDFDKIKITSGYKLDVNLKVDKFDIKYPNNKIFISLDKLNFDINIFNFIIKKPVSIAIKAKDININLFYKKNYSYTDCLKQEFYNHLEKNNIDNLKFAFENFKLNLYDENVDKNYIVIIKNPKISKSKDSIDFYLEKGKIASNKTILDFSAKVSYLFKDNSTLKLKEKILSFNYNPFLYADKYNFYAKSDVNLKILSNKNKNNIQGKLFLDDCTFSAFNIKLPKNSFLLDFKGDKIFLNCNFNLIKNQFIKIQSKMDISKNKFIEANIKSNDVNLNDLSIVLKTLLKIIKPSYNFDNYDLKGNLRADLYLKSNFKTIKSSGILNISRASFVSKKPNLKIDRINSDINFSNDKINILDTSCFFDKAKFYIKGNIDTNSNLNLSINSEQLPISTILDMSKKFISDIDLKNIDFKEGTLKIKSDIKGTLKNPLIYLTGVLNNFKIYQKQYKLNLFVLKTDFSTYPKLDKISDIGLDLKGVIISNQNLKLKSDNLKLILKQDDVDILNSKFNLTNKHLNLNNVNIIGSIKNYKKEDRFLDIILKGNIKSNNKDFLINPKADFHPFEGNINIKNDKLNIKTDIIKNGAKIINILGTVDKISSNNPVFNNFKVTVNEKINVLIKKPNNISFNLTGNFNLSNTLKDPKINGFFDLSSIVIKEYNVFIQDAKLTLKDAFANLSILKGKINDMEFALSSDIKISPKGIVINNVSIASEYINYSSIEKYLKYNLNNTYNFDIQNLKGVITKFLIDDITFSSFYFEGNFKNNVLNISKYQADLYNGKIEGSLNCNLNNLKVKLNAILKGVNVRYFSNRLKQYSIAISGYMSALVDVNFIYSDTNTILKTLDGYIKFNIDDGELNHFAKLERFLQAGNILSQSILKLNLNFVINSISKQNTGYFKTIEGTLKVKDSILDIQYIKTQGANMSMYLKGKYNLLTNNVSIKLLGIIPTNVVNAMGSIGRSAHLSGSEITKEYIDDMDKVPSLLGSVRELPSRLFSVVISGDILKVNSIKVFRWIN